MIAFIIVRILDILTTFYGMSYGLIEANPLQNWLIKNNFFLFFAYNLGLIYFVSIFYKDKPIKILINILTIINFIIVFSNIYNLLNSSIINI